MHDRILGLVGLLLSAFYIWQATLIETSFISDPVGPKTFPIIIGAVLALSSIVILILPDKNPVWPSLGRFAEIGIAFAVMIAYTYLLPAIGFVGATIFASAYLAWRLGAKPLQSGLAGLCISFGIYAVFHLVLGLSLAKGPLGF